MNNKWFAISGMVMFLILVTLFSYFIYLNNKTNQKINDFASEINKKSNDLISKNDIISILDNYTENNQIGYDDITKIVSKHPKKITKKILNKDEINENIISNMFQPQNVNKNDVFLSLKNVGPYGGTFIITKEEFVTILSILLIWKKDDFHANRFEIVNYDINSDKLLDVFLFDNSYGNTWKLNENMTKFEIIEIENLTNERTTSDMEKLINLISNRFGGIELAFKDTIYYED